MVKFAGACICPSALGELTKMSEVQIKVQKALSGKAFKHSVQNAHFPQGPMIYSYNLINLLYEIFISTQHFWQYKFWYHILITTIVKPNMI